MKASKEKVFNTENATELGFEYNYFEGYSYNHPLGFSFSVYSPQIVRYKFKDYEVKTVGDFLDLKNKVA